MAGLRPAKASRDKAGANRARPVPVVPADAKFVLREANEKLPQSYVLTDSADATIDQDDSTNVISIKLAP